jgi:molybdate transport system substrate-binding protein
MATELRVLSAGAVKPALAKLFETFGRETGYDVKAAFATAPEIRKRLDSGETLDVVIAPPQVLDDVVKGGKARSEDRVTLGRIGIGVMVRADAPVPKIGTVEEFKQALLDTESVVYNQASTGIYLEALFDRLKVNEQLKPKTTRYPDAAPVLDKISKGKLNEIGLAATTVIIENESKGLKFVGPLPAEIQNYTTYAATVLTASAAADAALSLVRYLTTAQSKAVLTAAGIE